MARKPGKFPWSPIVHTAPLGLLALCLLVCVPRTVCSQTTTTIFVRNTAVVTANVPSGPITVPSNQVTTPVTFMAALEVSPGQFGLVVSGAPVQYVHTIRNVGNVADTYNVAISDDLGWPWNLATVPDTLPPGTSFDLGPVSPGDSVQVQLQVTTPTSLPSGTTDHVSLAVSSQRIPTEQVSVMDTTRIDDPTFDPCRLSVTPTGVVTPGTVLRYTFEFGNLDPANAIQQVCFEDTLDQYLLFEAATSGTLDDEAMPGRTIDVQQSFDPVSNLVKWSIDSLPPGFRGRLELMARVSTAAPPSTELRNRIDLQAQNMADKSSNSVSNWVLPQLVALEVATLTPQADPGDPVLYNVQIDNLSGDTPIQGIMVQFHIPEHFRFLEHGSSSATKPLSGSQFHGRTATFTVPSVAPGESEAWTIACGLSERIPGGNHFVSASVSGTYLGLGVFESSEAPLLVRKTLRYEGIVTGRVYVDEDDNAQPGIFEGLPSVRVILEDGTQSFTDARGRYHIEGIRPGTHVVRIDRSSLPSELEFDSEGRLAAGGDLTRFVDVQPGELRKVNFRATAQRLQQEPRYEIAFEDEVYRFYEFSLFDRNRAILLSEARRMLLNLQAGVRTAPDSTIAGYRNQALADGTRSRSIGRSERDLLPSIVTAKVAPESIRVQVLEVGDVRASQRHEDRRFEIARTLGVEFERASPKLPRVPLEARVRTMSNRTTIISPEDGIVAPNDRIRVEVKFPASMRPQLYVNGQAVSDSLVGTRHALPVRNIKAYEYIGVPLRSGENTIEFESCKGTGECHRERITVWRAGEPSLLQIRVRPTPADGRTEPEVKVALLDELGRAVSHAHSITLDVEGGILEEDADPRRDGTQIRLHKGFAIVHLPPSTTSEERRIRAYFADLMAEKRFRFEPAPSDWVVAGLAEVGVTNRPNEEPLTPDQLRDGADARGGLFAQGRVGKSSQLTLRYDSERERDELYGRLDREELFPALGDATYSVSSAPSQWKLFARLDVPEGHAQVGDFSTGWTDLEFARFDRRLTGLDGSWFDETNTSRVQGFVAGSRQGAAQDEFIGGGTSGPFTLSRRPLIVNSEHLYIETRGRIHAERVIRSRPLTRFVDYTINYLNGTVLLKEPLASADAEFNPNYLLVQYETIEQDEEKPLFGLRGQTRLGNMDAGLTAVHEETAAGGHSMFGFNSQWAVREDLTMDVEYAHSKAFTTGNAYQIALNGHTGRWSQARVYFREVDEQFSNDSRTGRSQLGTRKYGMEADIRAGEEGRVRFDSYVQEETARNLQIFAVVSDYEKNLGPWRASVGHRLTGERGGTSRTANLAAATLRRRWNSRLGMDAGFQKAFGSTLTNYPSRISLGVDTQVTERLAARVRQEWDGSHTGRSATLVGLESRLNQGTALTSRFENVYGEFESRATAFVGLRTSIPLNDHLSMNASGEQGRVFEGSAQEASALSVGLKWEKARRLASLQYEASWAGATNRHSLRGTTALHLGPSWSLLGRQFWDRVRSENDVFYGHDVLMGASFRSPYDDYFHCLLSMRAVREVRPVDLPGVYASRKVVSLESSVDLARHLEVVGGYAMRFAEAESQDTSAFTFTGLTHARVIYDLGFGLDLSTGIRHRKRSLSAQDWSFGTEAGVKVMKDLWVVGGYNFLGFADADFPTDVHTGSAGYLTFRFKFDERFFGFMER